MCQNNVAKKYMLTYLLKEEGEKKQYAFIKTFNICMVIDYIVFILKRYIKDCSKIYDKQTIKVPKQGEYLKFQNFETEIK